MQLFSVDTFPLYLLANNTPIRWPWPEACAAKPKKHRCTRTLVSLLTNELANLKRILAKELIDWRLFVVMRKTQCRSKFGASQL